MESEKIREGESQKREDAVREKVGCAKRILVKISTTERGGVKATTKLFVATVL